MKQAYALKLLVTFLAVSGCSSRTDPAPDPASPGSSNTAETPEREQTTAGGQQEAALTQDTIIAAGPSPGGAGGEPLEATVAAEELAALHAGARALVDELVGAVSRSDLAGAKATIISNTSFDEVVAPGFRGILGSGLLAKNHEELANLVEALRGHTVESWTWKPGKLLRSTPQSAFSRPLVQITGGTIELRVDGTFIAVRLDQIVRLESGWAIFQMHNP